MYSPSIVALINQHWPKVTHPMPIKINNAFICIDFDFGDTPYDTHVICMIANTDATTNTGNLTLCYMLFITIIIYMLVYFVSHFTFKMSFYHYYMFITLHCCDVCISTSTSLLLFITLFIYSGGDSDSTSTLPVNNIGKISKVVINPN